MKSFLPIVCCAGALAACGDSADSAEDRLEQQAEASAVASGPAPVALGLSEAQLLDADLFDASGVEIGDVAQVVRGSNGAADQLLVEIEDSNPDRFVRVPVAGLTLRARGDDRDVSTTLTRADLERLPQVNLEPR